MPFGYRSNQAFEGAGEQLEFVGEGGVHDGTLHLRHVTKQQVPAGNGHALFARDLGVVPADSHILAAQEEIGDLHRRHEPLAALGFFGLMMEPRGFNHDVRQAMAFQVTGAKFRVVHAQDFGFDFNQIAFGLQGLAMNFRKMVGESPGHDELANVMDEPGHIIRFLAGKLDSGDNFAGHQGGADAMLPKFAPGKIALAGEALEIFDNGRDDDELADFPDAEIEHSFFDGIDGGGEAVIDGIDQAQQARGEAGVAPDDFGDLRGVTLFHEQQALQGLVDAAEGRKGGATCQLRFNLF